MKERQRLTMAANEKRDFLSRRNAGRALASGLRSRLASLLGRSADSVTFIELEDSDQIRERASQSFPARTELERNARGYPFSSIRVKEVVKLGQLLPSGTEDVFVILPEADRVGLLRLSRATLNEKWGDLLEAVPDGFVVVDTALSNKVVIQLIADSVAEGHMIDLA